MSHFLNTYVMKAGNTFCSSDLMITKHLSMNLWLIVGMLIIIPKILKWTVRLSTEKKDTYIYIEYNLVNKYHLLEQCRLSDTSWGERPENRNCTSLEALNLITKNTDLTPSLRLGSDFSVQNWYTVVKVINRSVSSRSGNLLRPHSWTPRRLQLK